MADLLQFDEWLFRLINIDGQHPWLDELMPIWRNKYFWSPLYLFLLSLILINFPRKGWLWIAGLVLCVLLSDGTSSQLIKKTVERPRPCQTEVLKAELHLGIRCGGGYSFPSSHATNHFAVAIFWILTLGRRFRWIKIPLLLWAASIAFGQVYVGVHYPVDVIAGGILGLLIGSLVAWAYRKASTATDLMIWN